MRTHFVETSRRLTNSLISANGSSKGRMRQPRERPPTFDPVLSAHSPVPCRVRAFDEVLVERKVRPLLTAESFSTSNTEYRKWPRRSKVEMPSVFCIRCLYGSLTGFSFRNAFIR